MIIVIFEGLPGSGKTTLTRYLDKKFDFCKRVGEVIDLKGNDIPIEKHYGKNWDFFTKSDIRKLKIFNKKSKEKILLLDRGFPSTISHGFIRQVVEEKSPIYKIINSFKKEINYKNVKIHYIYLKNNVKKSLKRKKHKDDDIWGKEKNLEITNLFYELFFLFRENVFTIDVDKLSLNQTKKRCKKILLKLNKSIN